MKILLLNAGSSSLKCTLMESIDASVMAHGVADWAGKETRYRFALSDGQEKVEIVSWSHHADAVRRFIADLKQFLPDQSELAAVGHRIVHGGPFNSSVKITPEVRRRIAALVDLAPLHNPPSLETLSAAEAELPGVVHVAAFDTSFHATLPPEACTYPIPQKWTHDWGIRRFGFHGLSHAYCSRRAAEMLARPIEELRVVICHLGHGCSAAAVKFGRCIDTTMGFTPLEGLMMATRSGSVDPGIIAHVQKQRSLTVDAVESALNHDSGLLGVSGVSADMREVLAAAQSGHEQARLAIGIYVHRIRQAIGALTAIMGGIDTLVFTAGVGEHAAEIRESICVGLECLGLELDSTANAQSKPDCDVAIETSHCRILIVTTREDVSLLREVVSVLGQ